MLPVGLSKLMKVAVLQLDCPVFHTHMLHPASFYSRTILHIKETSLSEYPFHFMNNLEQHCRYFNKDKSQNSPLRYLVLSNKAINLGPYNKNQGTIRPVQSMSSQTSAKLTDTLPLILTEPLRKR